MKIKITDINFINKTTIIFCTFLLFLIIYGKIRTFQLDKQIKQEEIIGKMIETESGREALAKTLINIENE